MRAYVERNVNEAWNLICDTFKCDQEFTMRDAIRVGFPGVTLNNYYTYAPKLRALFVEVWQRTSEDGNVPHIVCVKNFGSTPTRERWVLPKEDSHVYAFLFPPPKQINTGDMK